MTLYPDLAIRMRRAVFNTALAEANLSVIGSLLAPNAILVTGTDSAVIAGRKQQLLTWKREFAASSPLTYTRIPETIITSPIEPIAFEYGNWEGVHSSTGQRAASGTYTAKWRQIGADWVIEAEIYLTLA